MAIVRRSSLPVLLAGVVLSLWPATALAQGPPDPSPPPEWETIGFSVLSSPIRATTIGSGPSRVLILGGIHGDEDAGVRLADRLVRHLSVTAPQSLTIRLVADANPDGTAAGTRTNSRGIDLNRNWPSSDFSAGGGHGSRPLSEPETRALHAEIESFDPQLVVTVHEARQGPFANYDGPGEDLAVRLSGAARDHDIRWHVVRDLWWPIPGSLGTWLGADNGIPVITFEFRRGVVPDRALPILLGGIDAILSGVASPPSP